MPSLLLPFAALLSLTTTLNASPAAAFVSPQRPHSQSLGSNNLHHRLHLHATTTAPGPIQRIVLPRPSSTRLHLFGFGEKVEEDQANLAEGELARFSHLLSADDNPTVKFDSLSIMMHEWSKLLVDDGKKMGLTTPVSVLELPRGEGSSGVQLLFVKGKQTGGGSRSAYQDKDDEKLKKEGDKKEKDAIKEGGVEVRVEQLEGGDLEVTASRCEIEEGTVVKEMSEQTIIDSLRKAMAAWKKEQGSS